MNSPLRPGQLKGSVIDGTDLGEENGGGPGRVSNKDIFELLLSMSNSIEQNTVSTELRLKRMEDKLVSIEQQMTLMISAVAVSPSLRANTTMDSNPGSNTGCVMYKIPASLLFILWRSDRPDDPFPVGEHYITKLCFWVVSTYPIETRRALGAVFDTVLREPGKITLGAISRLLSDSQSTHCGSMRASIINVYERLATDYAFLIPSKLQQFLLLIPAINSAGTVTLMSNPNEVRVSPSKIIRVGEVLNVMGEEWILKNAKASVQYGDHMKGTMYFRNLCKTLKDGRKPMETELRGMSLQMDEEFGSNYGVMSITDGANSSHTFGSTALVTSRGPSKTKAKAMFST